MVWLQRCDNLSRVPEKVMPVRRGTHQHKTPHTASIRCLSVSECLISPTVLIQVVLPHAAQLGIHFEENQQRYNSLRDLFKVTSTESIEREKKASSRIPTHDLLVFRVAGRHSYCVSAVLQPMFLGRDTQLNRSSFLPRYCSLFNT